VQAARFDRNLTRSSTPVPLRLGKVSGSTPIRAAAARGVGLVAWLDSVPSKVTLKRIAPDGAVTDVSGVLSQVAASGVAVASDGDEFLVTRPVRSGDTWQLYAQRISAEGLAPDPASVVSTSRNAMSDPSVSFDGARYLVSWRGGPEPHVA